MKRKLGNSQHTSRYVPTRDHTISRLTAESQGYVQVHFGVDFSGNRDSLSRLHLFPVKSSMETPVTVSKPWLSVSTA